jgi:ElaA protein
MKWSYRKFDELQGYEVYEMLRLRIDVFIVEQNCPFHEADGHDYEAVHIFCMDEEEKLAAYARLLPAGIKYKEPSVGRVIVKGENRGTGLAHTLMECSVRYIMENWRPKEIRLQAQTHLSGFYGKHGFEAISEPYDEDGIPHVDMILTCVENESFQTI